MGVEALTAAVVALALLPLLAAARDSGSRAVLALAGVGWLAAAVGAGLATRVYREDRPLPKMGRLPAGLAQTSPAKAPPRAGY